MKVLIIEDSSEIVEAVSLCFQVRWPDIEILSVPEGLAGMEMIESESLDIVILDIGLPDIDGFELLRQIRDFSDVPVVILTVRGGEQERVDGLEIGADDYIVKPFRPADLVARVGAVLRRSQVHQIGNEESIIVRGKLSLHLASNKLTLKGKEVKLTPTEARLLYILMKMPNITVSRAKIIQEVWGQQETAQLLSTHIRRLRRKLNDKPPEIILTDRGEGYQFIAPN